MRIGERVPQNVVVKWQGTARGAVTSAFVHIPSAEPSTAHTETVEAAGTDSIILDISAAAEEEAKRADKYAGKHADKRTDEQKERERKKEQERERMRQETENRFSYMFEEMRKAREQAEATGEIYKEKYRCLLIAMRIMAGDNVPASDQRYLAEKDLDMYSRAVSLRRMKEDPKDHDSVLEDEKKRNANASGEDSGVVAAGAAGGTDATDSAGGADTTSGTGAAGGASPSGGTGSSAGSAAGAGD